MYVNNDPYPIKRGDGTIFMNCHFHKFMPSSGQALQLDYCQISIGTYLYVLANPYRETNVDDFNFACAHFPILHFDEENICHLETLFERLRDQSDISASGRELRLFYVMEMIGTFIENL